MHNKQLPHPLAPPNLAKLPSGVLLLVTEPHLIPVAGGLLGTRYVLAAQVSFDDGASWVGYQELQYTGSDATQSYASLFVDGGAVHISHYRIDCTGAHTGDRCIGGWRFAQYVKLQVDFFLPGSDRVN